MGKEAFCSPSTCNRKKQPLLTEKKLATENGGENKERRLERSRAIPPRRIREVAGGATAECVAVCCCFPCTLLNMLILAVYKLPARLCQKAKKKRKKNQHHHQQQQQMPRHDLLPGEGLDWEAREALEKGRIGSVTGAVAEDEVEEHNLEKEMLERFQGTGFWRSPSVKDQI
ncbi:hypothetical protein LINPERPRIM_LOCUS6420 [Linum perenne]